MDSQYMNNFRHKQYTNRDRAVSDEQKRCQTEVEQLRKRIDGPAHFARFLPMSLGISFGGIMIGAASSVGALVIIGPILGFGLHIMIWSLLNRRRAREAEDLTSRIAAREKQCEERCLIYNRDCNQAIAQEEKKFYDAVSKARKTYGGSTVIDPIIQFVADFFETQIKSANRESYTEIITATTSFRVDETQICLMQKRTYGDGWDTWKEYNLYQNRFDNLPELFDRIGYAQALAKRVEFEILRRFPTDPVAPHDGFKPRVEIDDSGDTRIELTYKVENPKYKTAVDMRTGIGS